ncbi:MAG: TIR domain-containing protein [Chloroflexota bacterium]
MDNPTNRKDCIEGALYSSSILQQIEWTGAAAPFTKRLIRQLDQFGEIAPGELALVALLEEWKQQVGDDRQKAIDELISDLSVKDTPIIESASSEKQTLPNPSPNTQLHDHIFISYATPDRPFVNRLAEDLRQQGHIVWADFTGIRGGEVWRQSIVDGIYASLVVLVVVTPSGMNSGWVAAELEKAHDFEKRVIPLWGETLNSTSDQQAYKRLGLAPIQYRDFRGRYDAALSELLTDLPQPQAGLPGYCQKLVARLAEASWGLDHYIQEEAKLLPIHASPYEEGRRHQQSENLLHHLRHNKRTIVLGEPGMGKSVTLERLAWELASS